MEGRWVWHGAGAGFCPGAYCPPWGVSSELCRLHEVFLLKGLEGQETETPPCQRAPLQGQNFGRSDFLIPGFRQGFAGGMKPVPPCSRLLGSEPAAAFMGVRLGDPESGVYKEGWQLPEFSFAVSTTHPNILEGPQSWQCRTLPSNLCPVFGSESDISMSVGSLLVVRTYDASRKPTLGLTTTPARRPGPCPEAPRSLEGGRKDSLK